MSSPVSCSYSVSYASAIALVGLSAVVSTVSGYAVTTTPMASPTTRVLPKHRIALPTDVGHQQQQQSSANNSNSNSNSNSNRSPAPTYDLGIGKNQPVVREQHSAVSSSTAFVEDRHDATRYWIEYESARPYPSPLTNGLASTTVPTVDANTKQQQSQTSNTQKRSLPKVQPQRMAEDVLSIVPQESAETAAADADDTVRAYQPPTIFASSDDGNVKLDVNTIWVEMLIHSEQQAPLSTLTPVAN